MLQLLDVIIIWVGNENGNKLLWRKKFVQLVCENLGHKIVRKIFFQQKCMGIKYLGTDPEKFLFLANSHGQEFLTPGRSGSHDSFWWIFPGRVRESESIRKIPENSNNSRNQKFPLTTLKTKKLPARICRN